MSMDKIKLHVLREHPEPSSNANNLDCSTAPLEREAEIRAHEMQHMDDDMPVIQEEEKKQ